MMCFAQIPQYHGDSETRFGMLAALALCCLGVWMLFRRLIKTPTTPDPWDDRVALVLESDEAIPLCHCCLAQHSPEADFCPECGASVGKYTNLLPYPYLFSIGHALRIGAFGKFKRSALTAFLIMPLVWLSIDFFAPTYWSRFLRNVVQQQQTYAPSDQPPAE